MPFANRFNKLLALTVAIVLTATACGSTSTTTDAAEPAPEETVAVDEASDAAPLTDAITIANNGTTALEGHTPRGFAGSGVGLFAGDNLNPNFPAGEGIQILLHFALPDGITTPGQATLRSDALSTRGNVFEGLGNLRAARVEYEAFGPELFNIEPVSDFTICELPTETSLTCDVTAAAAAAVEAGNSSVQLQLTFENLSDNDGEQDLALFFLTDSNTNEPGIFTLELR